MQTIYTRLNPNEPKVPRPDSNTHGRQDQKIIPILPTKKFKKKKRTPHTSKTQQGCAEADAKLKSLNAVEFCKFPYNTRRTYF
jgi:hypothetical protein